MCDFFISLLAGRSIMVRSGTALSPKFHIDMGVPQGSVISPLAFSVMLHDIDQVDVGDATTTLYADDLALWQTAPNKRLNTNRNKKFMVQYREAVKNIENYMSDNGFTLSHEKTVFIIFTNHCRDLVASEYISINNSKIFHSDSAKYLGVWFDKSLSWRRHIDYLIDKVQKPLNLIKLLSAEQGISHPTNMIKLIAALVRSRLAYGQEVYYSAPKTYLNRLQSTETRCLKLALRLNHMSDPLAAYREAGLVPLSVW